MLIVVRFLDGLLLRKSRLKSDVFSVKTPKFQIFIQQQFLNLENVGHWLVKLTFVCFNGRVIGLVTGHDGGGLIPVTHMTHGAFVHQLLGFGLRQFERSAAGDSAESVLRPRQPLISSDAVEHF